MKEFGPATGHTCKEPSGFGVWPRTTSSLDAAISSRYFAVSSATRSEIRPSCASMLSWMLRSSSATLA